MSLGVINETTTTRATTFHNLRAGTKTAKMKPILDIVPTRFTVHDWTYVRNPKLWEKRYGSNACSIFTLFSKLPVELRLMVWKYALPGQRVFKFDGKGFVIQTFPYEGHDENILSRYNYHLRGYHFDQERKLKPIKVAFKAPYSLLATNKEARAATLEQYTLTFMPQPGTPLYIDPDMDIFVFREIETIRTNAIFIQNSQSSPFHLAVGI